MSTRRGIPLQRVLAALLLALLVVGESAAFVRPRGPDRAPGVLLTRGHSARTPLFALEHPGHAALPSRSPAALALMPEEARLRLPPGTNPPPAATPLLQAYPRAPPFFA